MIDREKLTEIQNLSGLGEKFERLLAVQKQFAQKMKLIDLLTDRIPGMDNELRYVDDERVERLADYLIANGVTVTTGISFECKYVDEDGCPQTIRRMIKVLTNADRIRAMSDEELANFMAERTVNESTLHRLDKDHGLTAVQIEAIKHNVYCAFMQWLKQPVKTENADRCVCCGAIIPEGNMVCPNCLVAVKER